MSDLQKNIKLLLENKFKSEFNQELIIEYVENVERREKEILKNFHLHMDQAYKAKQFTGAFIPSTNKTPYYILVKKEQNDQKDIITVFHEFQHARLHESFLNEVFQQDIEKMKNSHLNKTFQFFSEFQAVEFSILQYIKLVRFEHMTEIETCEMILNTYQEDYLNIGENNDKYNLLMYTLQFAAVFFAVYSKHPTHNWKLNIKVDLALKKVATILQALDNYRNSLEWYNYFDEEVREYIEIL